MVYGTDFASDCLTVKAWNEVMVAAPLIGGKAAYPAAIDATRRLHEAGCRLFIISNSSRRSGNTLKKLEPMGYDPEWFSGVVTSGEITHQRLSRRGGGGRGGKEEAGDGGGAGVAGDDDVFASLGDNCLHFTWGSRGAISLEGLGLTTVTDPKLADFILAHGTECVNGPGGANSTDEERAEGAIVTPLDDMRAMLAEASKLRLPMVVANPDFVTVGGGSLLPMPGTLARWYSESLSAEGEERSDLIQLMGKPAPVIYRRVMEMTGADGEETIAVGDSMEHDIAGAAGAG